MDTKGHPLHIPGFCLRKHQNRKGYNRKYSKRAMAADRDKRVESIQDVTVAVSHELCRCLHLSQTQLLRFPQPQRPGRHPDRFK